MASAEDDEPRRADKRFDDDGVTERRLLAHRVERIGHVEVRHRRDRVEVHGDDGVSGHDVGHAGQRMREQVLGLDGANLAAREKMALASTYAGLAFTRANVGNVHAIAHQLGGKYHTPHGLANAVT